LHQDPQAWRVVYSEVQRGLTELVSLVECGRMVLHQVPNFFEVVGQNR
jgi:hypothetical protein